MEIYYNYHSTFPISTQSNCSTQDEKSSNKFCSISCATKSATGNNKLRVKYRIRCMQLLFRLIQNGQSRLICIHKYISIRISSGRHFSLRQFAQYLQNIRLVFKEKTSDNYLNWLHFVPSWPAFKIPPSWHFSVSANVSRQYNLHLFQLACPFFPSPFPFSSVLFHFPLFVQELFTTPPRFVTDDISLDASLTKVRLKNFSGTEIEISNSMFEGIKYSRSSCNAMRQIVLISIFLSSIININITLILHWFFCIVIQMTIGSSILSIYLNCELKSDF